MLQVFDFGDNLTSAFILRVKINSQLLSLGYNITLPGKLGDKHALTVPYSFRRNMLIRA
ncbi:hypothetical protein D3C81_1905080 [compost metagenome]